MPTSRASSASSNSIPPGPSEPSSIPSAEERDQHRQPGARRAERDDDARGQHRADEQEKRSLVHTGIFAGRGRAGDR